MLTIFTTCKPFKREFDLIQRNAITSWTKLDKDIEILIFGDEDGTEVICRNLNLIHIKNVKRQYGIPVLSDIFQRAQKIAKFDTLCYVNSDIIFAKGLVESILTVRNFFDTFLISGIRMDTRIDFEIDYKKDTWFETLEEYIKKNGSYHHSKQAFDYFIFSKGGFYNLPPLVIGRSWWDNYLFAKTGNKRIPIFDATCAILAIHQTHDYSHVEGGYKEVFQGTATQHNLSFLRNIDRHYSIDDAMFIIKSNKNSYSLIPNLIGVKRYIIRKMPHFRFFLRGIVRK